jgi:16S rRNA (adenine1518-N6/adenine1519-N6)-dimethyltransferase
MKHIAKKRFGQNFLQDQGVINSLIDAISPQKDQILVEIGPGLGALTQPLLKKVDHLHVIEIDRDIIAWMKSFYDPKKITIHECDALQFDFSTLLKNQTRPVRVVGNLPYNISTPILFHLLSQVHLIQDMHFMLQKEVVERMVAEPSSKAYGRLSVMLQYQLHMEYFLTVPAEAFDPAPKVESAFVRCTPFQTLPFPAKDEDLFANIVLSAFGQRRKTIRNTLKNFLDENQLNRLGINPQLRAENLSVQDYVAVSNLLS